MEPICEAKFSDNSYGFRPNRSVENAIDRTYRLMQISHLHYVIEFDIKGFFDNVNHSKLIRQIWAMGIHDKHLIYILKRILTAPIRMPDGTTVRPQKGTPQGGIISPLLANIVLNELDHWVESQWQSNPVVRKHSIGYNKNGSEILSHGFAAMRKTALKRCLLFGMRTIFGFSVEAEEMLKKHFWPLQNGYMSDCISKYHQKRQELSMQEIVILNFWGLKSKCEKGARNTLLYRIWVKKLSTKNVKS